MLYTVDWTSSCYKFEEVLLFRLSVDEIKEKYCLIIIAMSDLNVKKSIVKLIINYNYVSEWIYWVKYNFKGSRNSSNIEFNSI